MTDDASFDSSDDEDSDLDRKFNSAANHMKSLASKLESVDLLRAYGLYKQAVEGPCEGNPPKWYEMKAKQKWDAWSRLGNMSSKVAKLNYVNLIFELSPLWSEEDKGGEHWVRVSTLQTEEDDEGTAITVYDMCKTGSANELILTLKERPELLNTMDDEGLGLLHWAADRGHVHIISILLELGCDISMKDNNGQTALHYAASCDHLDCVQLLLSKGADKIIKDDEGFIPADVTSEHHIKLLLL